MSIIGCIRLFIFKLRYRINNPENQTNAKSIFPIDSVKVGIGTYGPIDIPYFNKGARLTIGNYCSIGQGVKIMVGGRHDYKKISTYPFQSVIYHKPSINDCSEFNVEIEDDVWIGYEALILPGVHIGKGSVIGARAIVTKDVPPYSIVIGNKVVKQRFNQNIIDKIKDIDFSKISHRENDCYDHYCAVQVNDSNVDEIIHAFVSHN